MTWTMRQENVQMIPGLAAVIVAIAIAYYMVYSPAGSRQLSTVVIAALIVGVAVVATAAIAVGREEISLGLGFVYFVGGFLGFALAPQVWIIGLLLALPWVLDDTLVASILLLFVVALLALTVLTASIYQTGIIVLAIVVFILAGVSIVNAHSTPQEN